MLIYTDLVRKVIASLSASVRELGHVDPARVAVAAAGRHSGGATGNLATCYGLGGEGRATFSAWVHRPTRTVVAVTPWYREQWPELKVGEARAQYLVLVRLPRLLEKNPLATIVHELYHINPRFDGRMRPLRHGRRFDRAVEIITQKWLATQTAPQGSQSDLARAAQMPLAQLEERYGSVAGYALPGRMRLSRVACEPPQPYDRAAALMFPGYRLKKAYEVRPIPGLLAAPPAPMETAALELRHYSAQGSRPLARSFARYAAGNDLLEALG